MGTSKKEKESESEMPESWKKFLDMARTVVNVPKEKIEKLEEQKQKERPRSQQDQERIAE